MIKGTFLYPNQPGSRFNADYYVDAHMTLAIRLLKPALKAVPTEIGISSAMPSQPAPAQPLHHSNLNQSRLLRPL